MTTRSIDYYYFIPLVDKMIYALLCYRHRISLRVTPIKRNPHLRRILLQLVEGARTKRIRANQCRSPSLLLHVKRILSAGRCLP